MFSIGRSPILLIAILFVYCHSNPRQHSSSFPEYTYYQIIEDLDHYKSEMESYHPGLFWYQSEEEWNTLFSDTKTLFQNGANLQQFYKQLSKINASIRCGHTRISLGRNHFDNLVDTLKLFPVSIKWIDEKLVATKSLPDHNITKGDVILSINGIQSDEIVQTMLPYLSMDGFNITGKIKYLERRFSILYPALIDPHAKTFEIEYRSKFLKSKMTTVEGISFSTYEASIYSDNDLLSFRKVDQLKDTYYMKIGTFSSSWLRSNGYHYSKFLKTSFQELNVKNGQTLIIDLRGNGGGDDGNGSELMSYLMNKTFSYYKSIEVLPSYDGWGNPQASNGRYYITAHQDLKEHQPQVNSFSGDVYILIDGGSFSATSEFSALMHHHQRATFIGEETGGGYYGNSSGNRRRVTLPNTQATVSIPYWKYLVDIEGEEFYGKGVIPHHTVKAKVDDVVYERDAELNFAIQLISER